MKILGIDQSEGFILQVTKEEMGALMGKGSLYGDDLKYLKPGINIKMGKCYENAQAIVGFYNEIKSSVNSMKTSSTKILDFIASKENPIAPKVEKES